MSLWAAHDLEGKIVEALSKVRLNNPLGHHFGAPYVSSYQIAIYLERDYPATVEALGMPIGGAGTGQHDSLSQYIGRELSGRIKRAANVGEAYPIEGAFFSNEFAEEVRFKRANGERIVSSLAGTDFDMAMFRLS